MIERIIEYSAHNRFMVLILVVFATAGGIWAMYNIPLDAIPDLSDPQVIIFTEWTGRSPNLVEDQITYPIVTAMLAAPGAKTVRGFSFFGLSFVYVLFDEGTDIYWARSRVLEYLSGIQANLPDGVTPALGPDATGVGWGFQYVLVDRTGQTNLQELRSFQDWYLRYWLQSVEGVSEVASVGGFEKQYQVTLDPNKLAAYNLPISKVVQSIRSNNSDVGGRSLEFSGREYMIRGKGYVTSTREIEQVVVDVTPHGTPVLLRDVASVQLGPDMRRGIAELDGEGEVVGGTVVVRFGENVLTVIDRVKAKLTDIESALPPGVEVVTVYDRSDLIKRSITTLKHTVAKEMIIVAVIITVFLLHFRSALIAVIILPIAVVISFIPTKLFGISSNIMSLGGIAIAIGAMVDAACVLVENAHKRLEDAPPDVDRLPIIIQASKEVGKPIFFALLVITVSFMPVFALEAQEGRLFKPLAYTKTFAMFFAAVLSVTLAPALMALLIRRGRIWHETEHPISRRIQRWYHPWVAALMRRRLLSIIIALIAIISSVPVFFKIGSEFMPPLNEGDMLYMPTTLPGISITEAGQVLQLQDRIIKLFPEVKSVFGKAGRARTATDPAPLSMVETTILLKPESEWRRIPRQRWYSSWAPVPLHKVLRKIWPDQRAITWEELANEMDTAMQLPGWTNSWTMPIKTRIDMLTTGIRTPIGIKIFGPDLDRIQEIGEHLEHVLTPIAGTRSVFAERVVGGYYIDFTPNREQAARYGLTVDDVQHIVETAVGGMDIDNTIEGRERYSINVRYGRELRDDLDKLARVLVPTSSGAQVPITQLADIQIVTGPDMLRNEGGSLTGWVYVDIDQGSRDIGGWVEEARSVVAEQVAMPSGYYLEWTGQYEFMERIRQKLKILIPMTLLIIIVMLFMNFGSIPPVIIVLLSVPFALTGSIWAIYLLDYNMSIAVWVGMIALVGIATETGIVMIVYLEQAFHKFKDEGRMNTQHDLFEAITYGAVQRVRPKLMTVFTDFMVLIPIMLATGSGADIMKRIAAPMLGGLISSTILTLEIVPAIYSLWRQRYITWVPDEPPDDHDQPEEITLDE